MNVLRSVIGLLLVVGVCVGQTAIKARPDFSGVWILDESKSDLSDNPEGKVTDYVMTIVHKEPEFRTVKKYKRSGRDHVEESVYYTDGRPEFQASTTRAGHLDPEPVTRWDGKKLVRRWTTPTTGITIKTFPPLESVTTDEWKLSPDSNTLTRTLTRSGMVTMKIRYVFTRKS